MQEFAGERVLMRIHLGERDRFEGKPLYQQIVHLLRERHYAGATVVRAIMGFGAPSGAGEAAATVPVPSAPGSISPAVESRP